MRWRWGWWAGATKSPVIRRFAGRLFKQLPASDINPDEAVALGAAIQGAIKERRESIREVILTDVCPFTLGTEVVREWEDGKFENGVFCPIIERNTVIPASRTERPLHGPGQPDQDPAPCAPGGEPVCGQQPVPGRAVHRYSGGKGRGGGRGCDLHL